MSKPRKHTMLDDNVQVQREVEERMGIQPCIWQIKMVCKVLEGIDVITIAAMGSGKSLCYWIVCKVWDCLPSELRLHCYKLSFGLMSLLRHSCP